MGMLSIRKKDMFLIAGQIKGSLSILVGTLNLVVYRLEKLFVDALWKLGNLRFQFLKNLTKSHVCKSSQRRTKV